MLARGAALVRERGIQSDTELGILVDPARPFDDDPQLRQRLHHMYDAGAWVLLESAIADLPADLRWLYESGAVDITQLANLNRSLGTTTAADLGAAVRERAIRSVPGFDESIEAAIAAALPTLRSAIPRIPLGRATAIAEPILERLRSISGVAWAAASGSLRRGQETVGDIELVAAADSPDQAIDQVCALRDAGRVLHRSDRRVYLVSDRVQVGVRFPAIREAGSTLFALTGSIEHLGQMRGRAQQRGIDLDASAAHEEEIYQRLGLAFIPPEIRDGAGEIAAAAGGRLPSLISRRDIRGDLHMHTMWSDGRDSVEMMVHACRALGYEYMAITDHSNTGSSRALSPEAIKRQADEIAALRDRFPDIAILHGCEVDILPDGRLDFSDRVLEQFDIVLASLHQSAGQSPEQLLGRYVAAMRNPLVTMITHPTNRFVPSRPGYDLDYDRLFERAVETGTIVEVDGGPAHLDLPGRLARQAVATGAMLSVDSDCHRAELLGRQMQFGVTTARRGWIEPRHVVNTRPLEEVRAIIARKRERR